VRASGSPGLAYYPGVPLMPLSHRHSTRRPGVRCDHCGGTWEDAGTAGICLRYEPLETSDGDICGNCEHDERCHEWRDKAMAAVVLDVFAAH
jgi:hypothetical protein